jgi:hypothetical protein
MRLRTVSEDRVRCLCFAKTPSADQVVDLLVLIRRAQALRVGQEVFQLLDLAGVNVLRLRQFRQELVGYLL